MNTIMLLGAERIVNPLLDGFIIKATPSSKNISVIAVNVDKKELLVKFRRGDQYFYSNVSPEALHGILKADSVGQFHYKEIKDKFEFTKINDELFEKVNKD